LPLPSSFASRARNALVRFAELLLNLVTARDRASLPELYDLALSQTGYGDFVRDGTTEGEDRWENLMELRRVTQEYAAVEPPEALPMFLEQVALVSDVDGLGNDEAGPALLTLHAAKGLEFPAVFIVGMDEGVLPHTRSLDTPEAMEEERRLCYVGITRAKDHLYLVHTFRRFMSGQNDLGVPSRFLTDIPAELIEGQAKPHGRKVESDGYEAQSGSRYLRTVLTDVSTPRPASPPPQPRFQVGDTIQHAKFGEGVIIASHMTNDDQEIEVAFPRQGVKRLSVNLAPIQKLERS
jgi:DNA helicase-2/ATP-dependent DNA helicase PcrA